MNILERPDKMFIFGRWFLVASMFLAIGLCSHPSFATTVGYGAADAPSPTPTNPQNLSRDEETRIYIENKILTLPKDFTSRMENNRYDIIAATGYSLVSYYSNSEKESELDVKLRFFNHGIPLLNTYLEKIFTDRYLLSISVRVPESKYFDLLSSFINIPLVQRKHSVLYKLNLIQKSSNQLSTLTHSGAFHANLYRFLVDPMLKDIKSLKELRDRNLISNPASVFVQMWNFDIIANPSVIDYIYALFEHYIMPRFTYELLPTHEDLKVLANMPFLKLYKALHPDQETFVEIAMKTSRKNFKNLTLNEIILKANEENRFLKSDELKEFLDENKLREYTDLLRTTYLEHRYDLISEHFKKFSMIASNSRDFENILDFQRKFEAKPWLVRQMKPLDYRVYQRNKILVNNIREIYKIYFRYSSQNMDDILFYANNFLAKDFREAGLSRFAFEVTMFSLDILSDGDILFLIVSNIKHQSQLNDLLNSELLRRNSAFDLQDISSSWNKLDNIRRNIIERLTQLHGHLPDVDSATVNTCHRLFQL